MTESPTVLPPTTESPSTVTTEQTSSSTTEIPSSSSNDGDGGDGIDIGIDIGIVIAVAVIILLVLLVIALQPQCIRVPVQLPIVDNSSPTIQQTAAGPDPPYEPRTGFVNVTVDPLWSGHNLRPSLTSESTTA